MQTRKLNQPPHLMSVQSLASSSQPLLLLPRAVARQLPFFWLRRRSMMTMQQTMNEFEALAMPYMNALYRTACRRLGNPTEAEDIVQETYLQAWMSFHRFQAGTNFQAWMFKIMSNTILRHYSKTGRMVTGQDEGVFEQITYEAPVTQELHDKAVLAALNNVLEQFRIVVLLADVQGYSYQEVAAVLGIPLGTVMSRLYRGRKQLRPALTGLAAEYGFKASTPVARRRRAARLE
jgi:RNA polymerase sigma-70 factor (ECF subfamily)